MLELPEVLGDKLECAPRHGPVRVESTRCCRLAGVFADVIAVSVSVLPLPRPRRRFSLALRGGFLDSELVAELSTMS
jgi:hypothetical protein